jgi:methylase of polypeptide subunit release factors
LSSLLLAPQAWSHAYLTDYEPQIIELTHSNLERHQSTITERGSISTIELVMASMLDWVNSEHVSDRNIHPNIVIVANLPYIPETTFDENVDESAKKWEPREAFV